VLAVRCFYVISLPRAESVTLRSLDCIIDSEFCCVLVFGEFFSWPYLCFGSLFQSSRSFINMPDYALHEIIDIILLEECRRNYKSAAKLYRERYPDRRHPTHTVFRNCFRVRGKDNLLDLGLNVVHWK